MQYDIIPGSIGHSSGIEANVRLRLDEWYGYARASNITEGDDHVYIHPNGQWFSYAHWFKTEQEVLDAIKKAGIDYAG